MKIENQNCYTKYIFLTHLIIFVLKHKYLGISEVRSDFVIKNRLKIEFMVLEKKTFFVCRILRGLEMKGSLAPRDHWRIRRPKSTISSYPHLSIKIILNRIFSILKKKDIENKLTQFLFIQEFRLWISKTNFHKIWRKIMWLNLYNIILFWRFNIIFVRWICN